MLNMKNKLARRIMAFVLSGAMVISGLAPTGMTAYAAEASDDTGGGYVEEIETTVTEEASQGAEDDEKTASDETVQVKNTEETDAETASESQTQTSETESSLRAESKEDETEKESTVAEANEVEDETEKDEKAEDVREALTLSAISGSATFDVTTVDLELYSSAEGTKIADGLSIPKGTYYLKDTDNQYYFSVTSSNGATRSSNKRPDYYYLDGNTIAKIAGASNISRAQWGDTISVGFEVPQGKTKDVTVLWGIKGGQTSLKITKNGDADTAQVFGEPMLRYGSATKPCVSVVRGLTEGTYSLTFGNNYIYRIDVSDHKELGFPTPSEQTKTAGNTTWNFAETDLGQANAIKQYSLDIAGLEAVLRIDQPLLTSNGIGAASDAYIFVPVSKGKRCKLMITAASGKDGYAVSVKDTLNTTATNNVAKPVSVDGDTKTYICSGTEDYAKIAITADTLITKIEVQEIAQHTVSGTVSGIAREDIGGDQGATIVFTDKNDETYSESAEIGSNGAFSNVSLYEGTYKISIGGKDENPAKYPVTQIDSEEKSEIEVTADIPNMAVTVTPNTSIKTIKGTIKGFETLPENFALTFTGNDNSNATVTVNNDKTYTAALNPNITYTVKADGKRINDYTFLPETIKIPETETDGCYDITFAEKDKYLITLDKVTEGLYKDGLDLGALEIIFTPDEGEKSDEYADTFGINDEIRLREGTYSLKIGTPENHVKCAVADNDNPSGNGIAEYPLDIELPQLTVGTEAKTHTLTFGERQAWDFTAEDPLLPIGDIQNNQDYYYNGLLVKTKSVSDVGKFGVQGPNNNRVQINDGAEVWIPVAGSGTVTITTDKDVYSIDGVAASTVTEGTATEKTFTYEDKPVGSYMVFRSTAGREEQADGTKKTLSVYLKKIAITRTKEPEGGDVPVVKKHKIWIVGDSTVCTYIKDGSHIDIDRYYQRYGYGTMLDKYLDNGYVVQNIALSGRSSKSYLKDDEYKTLTGASGIREGDVLIIGFGHNDEKRNDTHYTNPNGDYQTEGSFAKSLYDNYVKIALDKGAQSILCTPIVHLRKDDNYAYEHVTQDRTETDAAGNAVEYKGGSYPQAIRDLGTAVNVPVVDLTQLTGEKWAELGYDEAFYLHASEGSDPKVPDTTHVNSYGAKMIAHILATKISELENVDLAQHITNLDDVATKADLELSINDPNKGDYNPPATTSKYGEDFGIFKATAFGSINTEASAGTIALGKDANGNMNIKVTGDNGKISAKNDGIAMYYYQIPSDAKFTFSAKATINAIGDDEEAAFGLMARDDMYIDKADESILSNYVVAGTFAKNSVNCFCRKGKELKPGAAITAVKAGDTYDMTISTTEDGYTCKFGDNELQANGYDFALAGIDSKYKYIGMFASKNADISFSDIRLTVNDKVIELDNDRTLAGEGGAVEVKDGFAKGYKYGYKDTAIFEVLHDVTFKTGVMSDTDKNPDTPDEWVSYEFEVDGTTYTGCAQFNDDATNMKDKNGVPTTVPTDGNPVFKITATKDSKITFTLRKDPNSKKNFYFYDVADDSDKRQNIPQDAQDGNSTSHTFYMKEGHSYYFFAAGSKVMVGALSIAVSGKDDAEWNKLFGSSDPVPPETDPVPPETDPVPPETDPVPPETDPVPPETDPVPPETDPSNPTTPDDKIPADTKLKTISINDTSKITIEAADVVYTKKQPYVITVTYQYTYEKEVDGKKETHTANQQLTEGLHYIVDTGDINLAEEGPKKVTIKGTGKKTDLGVFINEDKERATYTVVAKKAKIDIAKEKKISLNKSDTKQPYTGNYATPIPTIEIPEKNEQGVANYKVTYKNNVNVGKASVIVIGQGDYYGTKVLPFTITKTDLSKADLTITASGIKVEKTGKVYTASVYDKETKKEANFEYKGAPIELKGLQIKPAGSRNALRPSEDYTAVYKKNAQAGKATLTIKGANNFSGSIKIEYTIETNPNIQTELDKFNPDTAKTLEAALPAEYSSKGARLTEIKLSNGITLKENTDYKVKYGKDCKNVTAGQADLLTVTISGAGSYKNAITKNTPVAIKVVKGRYHIKANTIVEMKKATSADKLISAAKIMDASGAKVKPTEVELVGFEEGKAVTKITVKPKDNPNYDETGTELPCRVATKLGSLKLGKNDKIADQPFDGVNSVTLTAKRIANYLSASDGNDAKKILPNEIRIVSYKNNNKLGSATVTIEGTGNGRYYGTRNLKFKIALTASDRDPEEEETSPSGGSSEENPNPTEPSPTEPNPTEPGPTETEPNPTETEPSPTETEPNPTEPVDPNPPSAEKRIDVWDIGALEETDATKYRNNITKEQWESYTDIGTVTSGDKTNQEFLSTNKVSFGDLTIHYKKGDRLYSAIASNGQDISSTSSAKFAYEDGYTAQGAYYCGNASEANTRFITVKASVGDVIYVYAGTSDKKQGDVFFTYLGENGTQEDTDKTTTANPTNKKFKFIANYTGEYKISITGAKPMFNRVVRVPAADVSGTIDKGSLESLDGAVVKFVNSATGAATTATLSGTNFTAKLAAGYTYSAVLSGIQGYGFTAESKTVQISEAEALTGKNNVSLVIGTKEVCAYAGTIKGFAEGYDVSKLKVTMVADPDSNSDNVVLEIGSDGAFSASLEAGISYTIKLEGVNDYEVKNADPIVLQQPNTSAEIEVVLKAVQTASGSFIDLDKKPITGITGTLLFTNVEDEYAYETSIDNNGYSIALRDGAYSVKATIDGYTTSTHVIVEGGAVQKDLLLVSTAPETALEFAADLYVGYSNQTNNYETITKAIKAAKRMRKNEGKASERITIHIAPGTYQEQVIVDVPYITLKNDDPSKEVKLTWYYGIGYAYYSVNDKGYYDEERAYDQYEKKHADRWGCSVRVTATDFKAENIVFENSFNRYITQKEIDDGVWLHPEGTKDSKATFVRKLNSTVQEVASKKAVERAAAIALDSDKAEFYNCKFLGSQDTLYTSGRAYYKNCFIEGNTDYIFGDGDQVFDSCELSWAGYSDEAAGGYITANKDSAEHGYLFWNCTITANKKYKVPTGETAGHLGRNWGKYAKVIFANTKQESADIINPAGWGTMSNEVTAEQNENYKEYNTISLDGQTITMSNPRNKKYQAETPATVVIKDFFGTDWNPEHYTEESGGTEVSLTAAPDIVDDCDLNNPYPGNIFTVNYTLSSDNENDASIVKWYRVDDNDKKVLIKVTNGGVNRQYAVQREDTGFYIEVEVTPATSGGKTGTAQTCRTKEKIKDGWQEYGESEPVIGSGINIFLAGDSTVKDYSKNGMYNKGSALNEGSWGEYLQNFFDEKKVTIVNYANGGRSTRNFINEGSLDKIKENIKKGDYLFIQFGHNDCSAANKDRFVPVGEPVDGKYPVTEGALVAGKYPDDGNGTFKWFLKQYIQAAKDKEAIPVLITPVSRMNYDNSGNIKPHHDCKVEGYNTYASSNNAYVTAVKELADEEDVLLIDAFTFTKEMYEKAYQDDADKSGSTCNYGQQIMSMKSTGEVDGTHCNKLGGFIEAAYMADAIKSLQSNGASLNIASAIQAPKMTLGENTDGTLVFSVTNDSKLIANDKLKDYKEKADYWTTEGQKLIDKFITK